MIAGFEFGCRAPLLVRRENVGPCTDPQPWRLLYASDLHLTRRRGHLAEHLVHVVANEQPDAVLLGGDLIDRRNGSAALQHLVREVSQHCPLVAVAGNHDVARGLECVRSAVRSGGGHWLTDEVRILRESGRPSLHLHARPQAQLSPDGLHVLVAHHPDVARVAADRGYDAVFAGHLHGGQCVWFQRGQMLYPGAWFSRWNGLRFALGRTTMLVSRGAADTLPVRFRCPREVLLCSLAKGS